MSPGVYCMNDWKPGDGEPVSKDQYDPGDWRSELKDRPAPPTSNPKFLAAERVIDAARRARISHFSYFGDNQRLREALDAYDRTADETPEPRATGHQHFYSHEGLCSCGRYDAINDLRGADKSAELCAHGKRRDQDCPLCPGSFKRPADDSNDAQG